MDYTFKTGETSAVKKVIEYINQQTATKDHLLRKTKETPFRVGDDTTFDSERKAGETNV